MINDKYIEHIGWDGPTPPPHSARAVRKQGTWTIDAGGTRLQPRKKQTKRIYDKKPDISDELGMWSYASSRESRLVVFRNQPGFPQMSRAAIPDGMSRAESKKMWEVAKQRAKNDLEKIMAVLPDTDEMIQEALLTTLEVMRSPQNIEYRLRAARQLLDFLKAKPVAKTEVTVETAEGFLSSIIGNK